MQSGRELRSWFVKRILLRIMCFIDEFLQSIKERGIILEMGFKVVIMKPLPGG